MKLQRRPFRGRMADSVQITPLPDGIELYFRAARTPVAALWLAAFGAACFIAGSGAALALAPMAQSGPAGALSLWLMSIFIIPFVLFGVVFPCFAFYLVTNSLAVTVTASEIRSVRRVCGLRLKAEHVRNADLTALYATNPLRYRWPRQAVRYFNLVARTETQAAAPARRVVLAEGVRGEELLAEIRTEIVKAARLERLEGRGGGSPDPQ